MTPPGRPVKEDDLHARIDGQLPQERTADVEIYLAAHPEVEARFSQYAAQRQELRAAFFLRPLPRGKGSHQTLRWREYGFEPSVPRQIRSRFRDRSPVPLAV